VIQALAAGPLRIVPREPRVLWSGGEGMTVVTTGHLGFADASEPDRLRWLNGFRHVLDGLDTHLQVLIEIVPGCEPLSGDSPPAPADFDDMCGADLHFVDEIASSSAACVRTVQFVVAKKHASRLEVALRDLGVPLTLAAPTKRRLFGKETAGAYVHKEGWSRTWYFERMPGTELEPGWLFRLCPPGLRLNLSWHATPLPTAWIVQYLQRQLVSMRATRLQQDLAGAGDPALAGALPAAEDLQRRLSASRERAFAVATYLTLTCASRKDLEAQSDEIESAARASLCRIEPCTFRMFDGFLATQAVAEDRLQRKRVLDTSSLATFLPWLDAELNQPGGFVIGSNRATGCPVLVDPFDQHRYTNANVAVFGHSGAGKTYLLSALAMGALGRGTQVYLIDPEHEYGNLAAQLGGVDIQLALGSGHALNVLDLRPSDRRDEAWIGPATADAVDLCATVCGGLDEPERAVIEAAVRSAYNEEEEPLLSSVAARLPSSRVSAVLHRWVTGSLGQMFSAPTNVDLEAPIVVFGMRELRDEMVAPVHFLLAEALWSRIKRKDRRRMLIIDELGLLFEDATIRRFVVSLARRIRKYSGSLVFATQNPGDLLSSEAGAVVATNPAVVFFGAQRPGEAAKLQRTFHLSQRQRAFLESARRGEFLLAAGSDRLAVNVQAPHWQEQAMKRAREAARPPPRTGRLNRARAESPSLPRIRPFRSPARETSRAVRCSRCSPHVAVRPAVDRELLFARPVRDGVLPAPARRRGRRCRRSRICEDGWRRDGRPDRHDLPPRSQRRVRDQGPDD
jgi:KaiC/GvpD/RAD55 family RecA-like ATPase